MVEIGRGEVVPQVDARHGEAVWQAQGEKVGEKFGEEGVTTSFL
jgi:hypothetical protein